MLVSISVPLEPPDQQYWQAAVGYVELGMFQDANDQLEKIDPFNRAAPEMLAVRLAIYHGLKKWELLARSRCEQRPKFFPMKKKQSENQSSVTAKNLPIALGDNVPTWVTARGKSRLK